MSDRTIGAWGLLPANAALTQVEVYCPSTPRERALRMLNQRQLQWYIDSLAGDTA